MPFVTVRPELSLMEIFIEADLFKLWGTGDKGGQLGHLETPIVKEMGTGTSEINIPWKINCGSLRSYHNFPLLLLYPGSSNDSWKACIYSFLLPWHFVWLYLFHCLFISHCK